MTATQIALAVAVAGCVLALASNELWRRHRKLALRIRDVCTIERDGSYHVVCVADVRDDHYLVGGFADSRSLRHRPKDFKPSLLEAAMRSERPRFEWVTKDELRARHARLIWRDDGDVASIHDAIWPYIGP